MEEDIKFIERYMKDFYNEDIGIEDDFKFEKAIENLLKRYKQLEDKEKYVHSLEERYKELEEENAMLKKAIEEDVSKDSSSIKINAIKYQGYLEGFAERDRLAKEEYEECCKIEKNAKFIPISVIQNKIKSLEKEIDLAIDNSKGGLDEEFIKNGTELLIKKRVLQELLEERNK